MTAPQDSIPTPCTVAEVDTHCGVGAGSIQFCGDERAELVEGWHTQPNGVFGQAVPWERVNMSPISPLLRIRKERH